MTDAQIETAARKLCELRGINPDKIVTHGAEPNERGNVFDICLRSPAWHMLAEEVRAAVQVAEAIAFAKGAT